MAQPYYLVTGAVKKLAKFASHAGKQQDDPVLAAVSRMIETAPTQPITDFPPSFAEIMEEPRPIVRGGKVTATVTAHPSPHRRWLQPRPYGLLYRAEEIRARPQKWQRFETFKTLVKDTASAGGDWNREQYDEGILNTYAAQRPPPLADVLREDKPA